MSIESEWVKLDITWLKEESLESSDDLTDPQVLATEAITELKTIAKDLREIVALIELEGGVKIRATLPSPTSFQPASERQTRFRRASDRQMSSRPVRDSQQ